MKHLYRVIILFPTLICLFAASDVSAQVSWKKSLHFLYQGTITHGHQTLYITMGFYWDKNDGKVAGEYYYDMGQKGTILFTGAYNQDTRSLSIVELFGTGDDIYPTGNYFEGKNEGGWFKGKFITQDDGQKYDFSLRLIKIYKR